MNIAYEITFSRDEVAEMVLKELEKEGYDPGGTVTFVVEYAKGSPFMEDFPERDLRHIVAKVTKKL